VHCALVLSSSKDTQGRKITIKWEDIYDINQWNGRYEQMEGTELQAFEVSDITGIFSFMLKR